MAMAIEMSTQTTMITCMTIQNRGSCTPGEPDGYSMIA